MTYKRFEAYSSASTAAHDLPAPLAQINDVMFPKFPDPTFTDVAIVCGSDIRSEWLVAAAEYQFKSGQVKHIVVSGAPVIARYDERESAYMHRCLLEHGVPAAAITVENQAKHTGENITFSLPLIAGVRSVTLIALAGPRPLMTLRRHVSANELICRPYGVLPPGIDEHNWQNDPWSRRYIADTYLKLFNDDLLNYVRLNYCAEVDMAAEIALVKEHCSEPLITSSRSHRLLAPKPRGAELVAA